MGRPVENVALAVDGEEHVSGTIGCQKHDHVVDFAWATRPSAIAIAVFVVKLILGKGFHQVNVAIGFDRHGIDPNDANGCRVTAEDAGQK